MIIITEKSKVYECCIIKRKIHTLIIDGVYVKFHEKISQTCSKCGKIFVRNFTIDTFSSICPNCNREQTATKKYGFKNNFQSPKTKLTMISKYGVESVNQISEVKEKKKKIFKEKYGEENPWAFGSNRFKQSMKNKYGAENALEIKRFHDKIEQTNLKKYGVKSVLALLEIKEKGMLKKYGVTHNSYRKETLEKRSLTAFLNVKNKLKKYCILLSPIENYKYREKYFKLKWKCTNCGTIFEDYYANGRIPRCPICFPQNTTTSKLEKEIADWLKSININIIENTYDVINPLELDVYIPSKNLAIEFDGLYWHSELQGKDSKYHLDKTTKCKELGIQLLHIWENEWIEKQDIVKSIIKSKLGLYNRAIGARQCNIKEISSKEASTFYDQNHIQGRINSKVNIGLFFNDELVSCLSFSKPRYNKKYEWEITRFASLLNTTVHGSFGKLWKYFQQEYKPQSLITYSDKRYFNGAVYKKYFTELPDSGPAYWYIKNGSIFNRVEFQKHKLNKKLENFDSSLTEWENMQLNGWDRIWDCGNKVFVLEN